MTKKNSIIKTIIVDDEERAISFLSQLLSEFSEIELVDFAQSVDEGLVKILDKNPDIVFLDVQMPEKNGFELLHELAQFEPNPAIIFVTAFDEFAINAIKYSAFDYLLKPVDPVELKKAIRRYQKKLNSHEIRSEYQKLSNSFTIKKLRFNSRTGSVFIDPLDIVYVQADGNYSIVYTKDGNKEFVTNYISVIEDKVNSLDFFRAGRSLLIHIKYLKQIDRKKRSCRLSCNKGDIEIKVPYKYIRRLEDLI